MKNLEQQKLNAAEYAAERFLRQKYVLGLGGGSTVRKFIDVLAESRARNICVAADKRNFKYAKQKKLKIVPISSVKKIDLAIDGADGIDRNLNLIKGAGGGAIAHEKIIESAAKTAVIIADSTKLKKKLLRMDVPIEVLPQAVPFVAKALHKLGASAKLKKRFATDHGNLILNARFRRNYNPAKLEKMVKCIPGVVEVGIFTGLADYAVIGYDSHAEVLT